MNKKQIGNEGEKFVADFLRNLGFITEIHPRSSRMIVANGRRIYVSLDNDYHNLFDVKAERSDCMIYAQVKFDRQGNKNHLSEAQKNTDRNYSYQFPYQRIQTWQLWKEWIKTGKGRRHKEFRFRIQERKGFTDSKTWKKDADIFPKGNWVDLNPSELVYPATNSGSVESVSSFGIFETEE